MNQVQETGASIFEHFSPLFGHYWFSLLCVICGADGWTAKVFPTMNVAIVLG